MNAYVCRKGPRVLAAKILTGAFLGSTALSSYVMAQETAQAPAVEEIVVTGSRVVRDGYQAPTPVSVVGIEQLQQTATSNLADYVNQLPVLSGSSTPRSSATVTSTGQAAINGLSLRGLGTVRTLVLLNGQRTVGSILTGVVDVSELPQSLISRVDVVTGGASASYGSDALAGVVNFVLDTNFTGVKGEVSGGVTTYGDVRNWKINAAFGTALAGGKGHWLASAEMVKDDGLVVGDRPWNRLGYYYMNNPAYTATNGQPQVLALYNVATSVTSWGGTIANGPLRGTTFGPGGAQTQTVFGSVVADPLMSGGSWATNNVAGVRGAALQPTQTRQDVFTRASFDISDNVTIFGHAAWGHLYSFSSGAPNFNPGNLVLKTDNAFIPANLLATLQAAGPTVTLGTFNQDLDNFRSVNDRRVLRFMLGAQGNFDALDTNWKWDSYLSVGTAFGTLKSIGARDTSRFTLAIDAVRNPATGAIVCRSTLTNPTNGCVPYNPFGIGVNSQAAVTYLQGRYGWAINRLNQKVAAVSFNGEPLSTWAGPVSIATGLEHREEKMRQITDPEEQANPTIWFQLAGQPYSGKFTVTEGFVETVVPLAKDTAWAKSFELNGAVRGTGYSTFGTTATWKIGATYSPMDDLRFRLTRSRNIREPTLVDLYLGGSSSQSSILDPLTGQTVNSRQTTTGNPNLQPEKSQDLGLGVVVQPSFFPGFSASFDYYKIDISGAVNTLSTAQRFNLCAAGNQLACDTIVRTGSGATALISIRNQPQNFATETSKGFDIEASYALPLSNINSAWDGRVSARFLATHYISYITSAGVPGTFPIQQAGTANGVPSWRYDSTVSYNLDPITVGFEVRGLSGGLVDSTQIECTSGCPTSTTDHVTVNQNHFEGAMYVDMNFSYRLHLGDASTTDLFLNVKNVANSDPKLVPRGPGGSNYDFPAAGGYFDILGRVFRAGVRFKM